MVRKPIPRIARVNRGADRALGGAGSEPVVNRLKALPDPIAVSDTEREQDQAGNAVDDRVPGASGESRAGRDSRVDYPFNGDEVRKGVGQVCSGDEDAERQRSSCTPTRAYVPVERSRRTRVGRLVHDGPLQDTFNR